MWDGTTWSALVSPSGGPTGPVFALSVFDDGTGPALYVGGAFASAGRTPVSNIAKLHGGTWSPLGTSAVGVNGVVRALEVFDDGSGPALFVGGTFTSAGGSAANRIAKWTGSQWQSLGASGGGTAGEVWALEVFDAGAGPDLYVGGFFSSAGGLAAASIARWDGAVWSPLGSGVIGTVRALAVHGSSLAVAGNLVSAGGSPVTHIAAWNGSAWGTLGTPSLNGQVHALAVYDPGQGPGLHAGGAFQSAGGQMAHRIARWDGTAWSALGLGSSGQGMNGPVLAFASHDDGVTRSLYAGGYFTSAGGLPVGFVAKWDGSTWSSPGGGANSVVYTLTSHDDGSGAALYAGGVFTSIGGVPAAYVARWNGSTWSPVGGGTNGFVFCLASLDDGSGPALYAAGAFSQAGGMPARVARWDGVAWQAVGTNLSGVVNTLAVFDDGSGPHLYAGGDTNFGYVAKWSGSAWQGLSSGLDDDVKALVVFDGGSGPALFAGGDFETAGGLITGGLARWNGSAWSVVPMAPNEFVYDVLSLATFDDGSGTKLYVGGSFYAFPSEEIVHNLASWNGTEWSVPGISLDPHPYFQPYALAVHDDGADSAPDLYLGGSFSLAGDVPSAFIAQWHGCPPAPQPFCFGDGSSAACPCANNGLTGRGCENSAATGGGVLSAAGTLSPDALVLTQQGELASSLSIFLQGNVELASPVPFGDGLRCTGGSLKRLYVKNASSGVVSAPAAGEPSITARSAALGDAIQPGSARVYQVYYRDPALAFCPEPQGGSFNVGNALRVTW